MFLQIILHKKVYYLTCDEKYLIKIIVRNFKIKIIKDHYFMFKIYVNL